MKKILFLIHDLREGGAEKVLLNLVKNMDCTKFDITVMTLFDVGINKQFLPENVTYKTCFSKAIPGNSKLMKLFSPRQLHRCLIKDHYDIEVSYLEGPSARVISGCSDLNTKLVCWIHIEQKTQQRAAASFRSVREAEQCYNRFHQIVAVSETVKQDFQSVLSVQVPIAVLYNVNETERIIKLAQESVEAGVLQRNVINLVGVGKLLKNKGFDRIARITERLVQEGYPIHTYILGIGPERQNLERFAQEHGIEEQFTLLGYKTNPYKYVSRCDLFVCASFAEGFSTAATEALIVGTPICTVEVSGMREMLGDNEYGLITENSEEGLYQGIKKLLDDPKLLAHFREQAKLRGAFFSTEKTVRSVERLLIQLEEVERNGKN